MPNFSRSHNVVIAFLGVIAPALIGLPPTLLAQSVTLTQTGSINFGTANVCPSGQTTPAPCANTLTLTYNVGAGTTIGGVAILTGGTAGLDFRAKASDSSPTLCSATNFSSAHTCTVDVTFAPLAPGQRKGAVQILDDSGDVLANTYIYGAGTGPAIAFSPSLATPISIGSGYSNPSGIAIDGGGNVFVADTGNNQIKEVLAAGGYSTIKTIGSGFTSPRGLALDGAGDLFVADSAEVKEIVASGGSIPATPTIRVLGSGIISPLGIAVDASGNVFITDQGSNASPAVVKEILAVDGSIPADPTIHAIVGNSDSPSYVALDGSGNLFVSAIGPTEDPSDVLEYPVAGGYSTFTAVYSAYDNFQGMAIDAAGDLYVAGLYSTAYELLAVNGSIPANPTTISFPNLLYPSSLAVDEYGNVFGAVTANNANSSTGGVYELPLGSVPSLAFHSTPAGTTSLDSPRSIQFQNIGNTLLTGSGVLVDQSNFTVVARRGTPPDCKIAVVSLSPGAACNFSLDFTPQSASLPSTTLTLTDNALNKHSAVQIIDISSNDDPIPTTTALTSSDSFEPSSPYGSPITFTARVGAQFGPTPTGNVVFSFSGQPSATVPLLKGVASYTISTLPISSGITVVATYVGTETEAASTSNPITQVISGYGTTTTLTSSANPAVYGQPVTFTATVAALGGGIPAGSVTFQVQQATGGYPTASVPLIDGVATYVTSTIPVSTGITVVANYSGSGADSNSYATLVQRITAKPGTINFSNGFAGAGATLQLNGPTSIFDNFLKLPGDGKHEAGSAFFKTRQNVQAFTTDFLFSGVGGDGFTFTIQNDSTSALGSSGGGLGYRGIPKSLAIKFDNHNNEGEGNDSTGLFTDGAFPGVPALDLTSSGISLRNDDETAAHITYDGSNLILTLTNPYTGRSWSHTWTIDIPSTVGGPTAYIGFTSATGDLISETGILQWTYEAGTPTPNYPTFNNTGLTLNGSSALSDAELVLTNGGLRETSSAFYTTPQYVGAFYTDFDFERLNPAADGFTFTIQNNSPTAIGSEGGGLGYHGIPKSVAIKFDLYNDAGEGRDSTGLYTDGVFPKTPSIDLTGTGIDLHSPDRIQAHISYNGVNLIMTLTDAVTGAAWTHSWDVDIPTVVGATSAYVGFTAGTGDLTATQTVSRWTYVPGTSIFPTPE